ncbi:hypothetical protein DL766_003926 [Monosporascus sp. MC13-8B]|uniref:Chitin-binding type-4 domain-containing protein n=1 Tax=Monosporascus cannonballus TaxID=155416 RepID=A0ABY0HLR0_9PEZI|nr:hypothetical protein DL763_009134 [Monosporascus cannonballus]RYO93554.1 hypothetical protein DL762_000992 [Monosporascus cannonballus]RYP32510.1 hypothetical protein DL766_003926 [Monosporascus sp. MC13-8B]
MYFTKTLAAAGLLAVANAHMLMKNPVPFPSQNLGGNGPLADDGSNFPCKYTGPETYANGEANVYPQGSKQKLQTIGQAVHGGGSCQISITYDTAPTKNSVWKVIHSIEGGCPARNAAGNAGDNADAIAPDEYEFTIPDNLPTGKGVIAWTWINRIGNREFYMNCGAVEITGNGGDQAAYDALPDMTVINIMSIGPKPVDGTDLKFAYPGKSLEDNLGAWGVSEQQGGPGAEAPDSPPAASSTAAATPSATLPGGVFITAEPSTTATAPTSAPVVEAPTTVVSSPAAAPTNGAGNGAGNGGAAGVLTGACSPEGTFNCIDGTSFQQCGSGVWSVATLMAPGTQCTPGQSTSMSVVAAGKKRSARRFRA